MSEDRMSLEEEILKQSAPLPVLSNGLRSRVLAAALEARENQQQSRRVIAGSLSLFALLSWFTWRSPKSHDKGQSLVGIHDNSTSAGGAADAASLGNSENPADDDFQLVESQLRNRQELFAHIHQM